MKAVIQRVTRACLRVNGEIISEIGKGLVVYLGVKKGDGEAEADYVAKKLTALRIFEDANGKINNKISSVGGEIMLVSQFTLLANASHGNRPDFLEAELPARAEELYLYTAGKIEGVPVKLGVFGADMKIEQINDGPFTLILEKNREV